MLGHAALPADTPIAGSVSNEAAQRALRVEFITPLTQLDALEAQWETLNRTLSDHDAPFFQSFAWSRHVASVRLAQSAQRYKLLVATVTRGTDLIGIWPLSLQREALAWVARNLDDPFGQFAGVLFERAEDITPGVAAVLHALRTRTEADALHIDALVTGSALHRALLAAGARSKQANQAVYVDLRPYASAEAFRQSVNKKTRKNLRNLRNRLKREHGLSEHVIDDARRLRPLVEQTFAARLQWLDSFGHTSPAFRDADFKSVVSGLPAVSGLGLLGFRLATGRSPVSSGDSFGGTFAASQWGFTYLGRYYAYVSARNPDYDEYSPGRVHLGMVIEACQARGIDVLELMPPASDYKLDWTDRTKRLDSAVIAFSVRGHIATQVMAVWSAPQLRTLSRAVPDFIRKPLIRRLNRSG